MEFIVSMWALAAIGMFLWGVISLFRRGKRLRGLGFIFISHIVVMIAMAIEPFEDATNVSNEASIEPVTQKEQSAGNEQNAPDGRQDQETLPKAAKQSIDRDNEPSTQPQQTAASKKKLAVVQPDEENLPKTVAQNIKRAETHRLINDRNAIDRFCKYEVQSYALSDEQTAKMAAAKDASNRDAIWAEYQNKQTQLLEQINAELGLEGNEFIKLSKAGYWNWYCRAAEMNWKVLTVQNAKAATEKDADEAERALIAFYLYQLDNETSYFFDRERYSTPSCRNNQLDGKQFVACRLRSISYATKWQMFILGRDSSNNLLVAPINGDTENNITRSGKSKKLDKIARNRTYLEAYDEPRAYLAKYAGPPFLIKRVQKLFE